MFIFSSNSAKYSFEYKVSKLYRMDYSESIQITPMVVSISTKMSASKLLDTVMTSVGNFTIGIETLLKEYKNDHSIEFLTTNIGITGIEIRELLQRYDASAVGSPDYVNTTISNFTISISDLLISHTLPTDTMTTSISNIEGILENV